jgi:histidine ammonia-lyase
MRDKTPVVVGRPLTLEHVVSVARHGAPVILDEEALQRIRRAREYVDRLLAEERNAYGITTGFGKLAQVRVSPEDVRRLQRNLIVSHAVGVGEPLPTEVVRAMLLLRAQSLSFGHSGAREEVVTLLLRMLDAGVHPVIPGQGSVGASGDLAPLAHMALTLIGEGEAEYGGKTMPSREALAAAGLAPVELHAKEGLALINGTQAMCSLGALAVFDAERLAGVADVIGAMTLEAVEGTLAAFDERVVAVRTHPGAAECAWNVRSVGAGSEIHASHADCPKVQDAYSLRCMPQVHGASRDALRHAREVLEREMNSVTDNPLLFPDDDRVISGGNFHGQPIALVLDYAKLAIAELGNISERRVAHLMDPALSGLPAFLVRQAGLDSGLMITQYTAASLANENKALAWPASSDSIPTSANQEDHVSMGMTSARHLRRTLENVQWIVAIELLCAAQGLDLRAPLAPAPGTGAALSALRNVVPPLNEDRLMQADMAAARELVVSGALRQAVEAVVGELR